MCKAVKTNFVGGMRDGVLDLRQCRTHRWGKSWISFEVFIGNICPYS